MAANETPHFEIPKECKAGVVINEGPDFHVEIQTVPVPEPGPTEVLIKINVTGICHSDIHFMRNDIGTEPMSAYGVRSAGHEGAGVVVKVGKDVTNFNVGDRAGVKPIWNTCGNCEMCWGIRRPTARELSLPELIKMISGTYQEYIVSPSRYTTRIPQGVDDYTAGPTMCSASSVLASLYESKLEAGDWAVFLGGGAGVGLQGVQLASAMGIRPIAVDRGTEKGELALKRGAEHFIDFMECKDPIAEVVKLTEGGAHGVFVTASSAYNTAIGYLGGRVGSKLMCIGLPPLGSDPLSIPPSLLIFRNMHITGTLVGSMKVTDKALDFAKRGLLKPIYTVYPIAKLPEAVEKLKKGEIVGRAVVDFNL